MLDETAWSFSRGLKEENAIRFTLTYWIETDNAFAGIDLAIWEVYK